MCCVRASEGVSGGVPPRLLHRVIRTCQRRIRIRLVTPLRLRLRSHELRLAAPSALSWSLTTTYTPWLRADSPVPLPRYRWRPPGPGHPCRESLPSARASMHVCTCQGWQMCASAMHVRASMYARAEVRMGVM